MIPYHIVSEEDSAVCRHQKLFQSQKNPKLFQAGMSMLNSTSKHRNFGISFGKTAARLEMVKLLKL